MAIQTVPYALQNASHSAALFRQSASAPFASAGTLGANELAVSQQGTPNMSVILGPGRAKVLGNSVSPPAGFAWTTQAMYDVLNDANLTLTVAASNPTNPRIDAVYVQVQDSFYSGAFNQAIAGIVTGTPAASPSAPAVPTNSILLGYIAVAANATSIVNANITQAQITAKLSQNGMGMVPITPTISSGTGITVGPNGVVTFTGAPGAGILTFATAAFDNYMIEAEFYSTAANTVLVAQACVGAAVDGGANYYYAGATNAAGSSSVSGWQGGSASSWDIARPGGGIGAMTRIELRLIAFLNAAKQSSIINQSISNTGTGAVHVASGGFYNVSKAHDGIAFTPASGGTTLTGTLRIYGYNNN